MLPASEQDLKLMFDAFVAVRATADTVSSLDWEQLSPKAVTVMLRLLVEVRGKMGKLEEVEEPVVLSALKLAQEAFEEVDWESYHRAAIRLVVQSLQTLKSKLDELERARQCQYDVETKNLTTFSLEFSKALGLHLDKLQQSRTYLPFQLSPTRLYFQMTAFKMALRAAIKPSQLKTVADAYTSRSNSSQPPVAPLVPLSSFSSSRAKRKRGKRPKLAVVTSSAPVLPETTASTLDTPMGGSSGYSHSDQELDVLGTSMCPAEPAAGRSRTLPSMTPMQRLSVRKGKSKATSPGHRSQGGFAFRQEEARARSLISSASIQLQLGGNVTRRRSIVAELASYRQSFPPSELADSLILKELRARCCFLEGSLLLKIRPAPVADATLPLVEAAERQARVQDDILKSVPTDWATLASSIDCLGQSYDLLRRWLRRSQPKDVEVTLFWAATVSVSVAGASELAASGDPVRENLLHLAQRTALHGILLFSGILPLKDAGRERLTTSLDLLDKGLVLHACVAQQFTLSSVHLRDKVDLLDERWGTVAGIDDDHDHDNDNELECCLDAALVLDCMYPSHETESLIFDFVDLLLIGSCQTTAQRAARVQERFAVAATSDSCWSLRNNNEGASVLTVTSPSTGRKRKGTSTPLAVKKRGQPPPPAHSVDQGIARFPCIVF